MELTSRFFESGAWLKPRRFSEPEAYIDLVGAHEAGLVGENTAEFFSLRWSWAPDEVSRFVTRLAESGWWNGKKNRAGKPAISAGVRQGPPAAQRKLVEQLHKAYNEEFTRRLTLTGNRRKAYARLLFAGLEKHPDPGERFRKLCRFVQTRDFYMKDLRLHSPESLFRTPERCESWMEESSGDTPVTPDHARERKKLEGFRKPTTVPVTVDVAAVFAKLPAEKQEQLRSEFEHRKKRLSGLTRFRDMMEQAVWNELVTREAG